MGGVRASYESGHRDLVVHQDHRDRGVLIALTVPSEAQRQCRSPECGR